MIYVSTGGFSNLKASESAQLLTLGGIRAIDFSGGKYESNSIRLLKELKASGISLALHNYFPPPEKSFVLNLASLDAEIEATSIQHVLSVLEYCSELDFPHYSIHGGFLLDPNPNELGKPIKRRRINDRSIALRKFIDNVNTIASRAKELGITLLLENNVLGRKNRDYFAENPLLMTCKDECLQIMQATDATVKLLIDVGHLKVSASSLDFDREMFLKELDTHIGGYHLSENDGLEDLNMSFTEDSWFWSHLKKDVPYVSIEVYEKSVGVLRMQKEIAKSFFTPATSRP